MAKEKAATWNELYDELDTMEGERKIYRIAAERDKKTKDMENAKTIKDENGTLLTDPEKVKTRWNEYCQKLLNEENDRNPT